MRLFRTAFFALSSNCVGGFRGWFFTPSTLSRSASARLICACQFTPCAPMPRGWGDRSGAGPNSLSVVRVIFAALACNVRDLATSKESLDE